MDATGEGSIAGLFDHDVTEFGFSIVGADGGTATVDFFDRQANSLGRIQLDSLANGPYAFKSDGPKIAGFSIFNNDPGGIGIDNIIGPGIEDTPSVQGSAAPEPSSLTLLGLGSLGLLGYGRRRRKQAVV
jgi:hypothetical protein